MEYLPNGELFDYVWKRQGLEEAEAKEIFTQIAEGVHYCHMVRMTHTHTHTISNNMQCIYLSTPYRQTHVCQSRNFNFSFIFPSQNSIVHRDLKLENILLDSNQQPKVGTTYSYIVAHYVGG